MPVNVFLKCRPQIRLGPYFHGFFQTVCSFPRCPIHHVTFSTQLHKNQIITPGDLPSYLGSRGIVRYRAFFTLIVPPISWIRACCIFRLNTPTSTPMPAFNNRNVMALRRDPDFTGALDLASSTIRCPVRSKNSCMAGPSVAN